MPASVLVLEFAKAGRHHDQEICLLRSEFVTLLAIAVLDLLLPLSAHSQRCSSWSSSSPSVTAVMWHLPVELHLEFL